MDKNKVQALMLMDTKLREALEDTYVQYMETYTYATGISELCDDIEVLRGKVMSQLISEVSKYE